MSSAWDSADLLRHRGNAAYAAADYAAAVELYSLALDAIDRVQIEVPREGVEKIYSNRAAARLQLRDFAGALEDADAALQINPCWAKAAFRRAAALRGLRQLPAALEAASRALALEPGNSEVQELVDQIQAQLSGAPKAQHVPPGALRRPPVTAAVLPPGLRLFEYSRSPDGVDENLLILLHGLGDRPGAFMRLGRHLALPQTALLALGGPREVPLSDGGRSWFRALDDDLNLIQPAAGEQRRVRSLAATLDELEIMLEAVQRECGWGARRVHLLGFSQGGTTALELARRCAAGGAPLASCVAVSAALLEEILLSNASAAAAPPQQAQRADAAGAHTAVLLTHGSEDEVVPRRAVDATAELLAREGMEVSVHSVPGKRHGMVDSPQEAEALMRFWSRQLRSRPTGGALDSMAAAGADSTLVELRPDEAFTQRVT